MKEFSSEVVEGNGGDKPLAAAVSALKKAGVLNSANRTDLAKGIFESDTGQLLLNASARQLRVVAPRLEGACLDPAVQPGPVKLGQVTVQSTSIPASVTAIAVDDRPLAESRRILLVYATDALNSGMTFTAPDRETLVTLGKPPALLRTGRLNLKLEGQHSLRSKLWALGLDGHRAESIPVASDAQSLSATIDTARLRTPTPFFELVTE